MSKDTDKNLFIVSSMPRFYQQLLSGVVGFEELGNRIIRQIKAAHAFRQVEQVRELSRLLLNFPIQEYQLIAQYYLVWCKCRELNYHDVILENIVEQSQTYKTQALISRAAFEVFKSKPEAALFFYTEAMNTDPSISEYVGLTLGIAVIKGIEGFHASAVRDMESLSRLIHHAEPQLFFNFHNSYATELASIGRMSEARNLSRIVMASPFAPFYPEWQETARELKEPDRAFISVPHIEHKPVEIETKETHHASQPEQPSRVVPFPKLKEVPPPARPKQVTPQEFGDMTVDERAELVLAAIRSGEVRENDYIKLVISLGLLDSGPSDKVIDLEDESLLSDIIMIWCNMIEPEQFASVMSALRDCKDDQRRDEIIDNMITIAFKQTHTSMQTEQEWRLIVERRLPKK